MRNVQNSFTWHSLVCLQCLVCQSAFREIWCIDDVHNDWLFMGRTCTACLDKAWHCLCVTPYHGIACITVPINIIIIINRLSWKTAVSGHAWLVQHRLRSLAFHLLLPQALCVYITATATLPWIDCSCCWQEFHLTLPDPKPADRNVKSASSTIHTSIHHFANASLQYIICQDHNMAIAAPVQSGACSRLSCC